MVNVTPSLPLPSMNLRPTTGKRRALPGYDHSIQRRVGDTHNAGGGEGCELYRRSWSSRILSFPCNSSQQWYNRQHSCCNVELSLAGIREKVWCYDSGHMSSGFYCRVKRRHDACAILLFFVVVQILRKLSHKFVRRLFSLFFFSRRTYCHGSRDLCRSYLGVFFFVKNMFCCVHTCHMCSCFGCRWRLICVWTTLSVKRCDYAIFPLALLRRPLITSHDALQVLALVPRSIFRVFSLSYKFFCRRFDAGETTNTTSMYTFRVQPMKPLRYSTTKILAIIATINSERVRTRDTTFCMPYSSGFHVWLSPATTLLFLSRIFMPYLVFCL